MTHGHWGAGRSRETHLKGFRIEQHSHIDNIVFDAGLVLAKTLRSHRPHSLDDETDPCSAYKPRHSERHNLGSKLDTPRAPH